MQLQFPVYRRGNTLVLHVRIAGRQVKRSLRTLDPNLAKVRATQLLGQLMAGELAANQPAAHAWTMAALDTDNASPQPAALTPEQALAASNGVGHAQPLPQPEHAPRRRGLMPGPIQLPDHEKHQLAAAFAEYGQIKKLRKVTQNDYASYAKEMVEFWGNRDIRSLAERDISNFIVHLRSKAGNDPRTIDNKTGFVRAVINFLIKHGRHAGPNPAADKNLVSKREKRKAGTKPFAYNDLKAVFGGEEFRQYGVKRPEIYLIVMVGLVTGMRVSSVARLTTVCETCGKAGELIVDGSYWVTACPEHAPEYGITADAWFQKKFMTKEELRSNWHCLKGVHIEHGRGWYNLLDQILKGMVRAGFDQSRDRITQVKEKFGSLRVYVDFDYSHEDDPARADRVLNAMLNADESASTCEQCGKPGQLLVNGGWWLTRCALHAPDGANAVGEYYGSKE